MNNYDFDRLSPIEFEDLVNDLLEKVYNTRIERFKEGRDRGIDGRFTNTKGEKVIIQSKHYAKTGYDGLINVLGKKNKKVDGVDKEVGELVKVENLNKTGELDKYIFATSVGLSPDNKKEIFKIFNGYIKTENDIYGINDLISILSNNKDVEDKYYKLWLTSSNVLKNLLDKVVNNDLNGRSKSEIDKYINKNKLFYVTTDFYRAKDILGKNNVIIITGAPGIGKSTLSEQICLNLMSKQEYSFYKINSIDEAERVWDDNKKQIFYFDDFLGSNYLETIDGTDNHIKNFIERVKLNKLNKDAEEKIFILNSRTTILKSGIQNSAVNGFKEEIEENEFILEINKMSVEEKAYILYNHLYYSDLDTEYIEKIYENQNYKKIINHKNYNPRLIEFITKKSRVIVDKDKYIDFIIDTLDNPKEIWKKVFELQSNDSITYLVNLTIFNGGIIYEDILKRKYNIYAKKICKVDVLVKYEFESIIKIAIENFLKREVKDGAVTYSVLNPSVTDYILFKYKEDDEFLIEVLYSLGTYEGLLQLKRLNSNYNNKKGAILNYHNNGKNDLGVSNEVYIKVINGLYKKGILDMDNDYVIYLFSLGNFNYEELVLTTLQGYIDIQSKIKNINIYNLIKLIDENLNKLKIKDEIFLIEYIRKISLNELGIKHIGKILDYISDKDDFISYNEELLELLEEKIVEYLGNEIENLFDDIDFGDYMKDSEDGVEIDVDEIKDDKLSEIEDILDSFSKYDFMEHINDIDIYGIYDGLSIDLDDKSDNYLDSLRDYDKEDYKEQKSRQVSTKHERKIDNVDYIFIKNK